MCFTGLEQRDPIEELPPHKNVLEQVASIMILENVGFTTRHHTFFEMLRKFFFW